MAEAAVVARNRRQQQLQVSEAGEEEEYMFGGVGSDGGSAGDAATAGGIPDGRFLRSQSALHSKFDAFQRANARDSAERLHKSRTFAEKTSQSAHIFSRSRTVAAQSGEGAPLHHTCPQDELRGKWDQGQAHKPPSWHAQTSVQPESPSGFPCAAVDGICHGATNAVANGSQDHPGTDAEEDQPHRSEKLVRFMAGDTDAVDAKRHPSLPRSRTDTSSGACTSNCDCRMHAVMMKGREGDAHNWVARTMTEHNWRHVALAGTGLGHLKAVAEEDGGKDESTRGIGGGDNRGDTEGLLETDALEPIGEEELREIDQEVIQEMLARVHKQKTQVENYCNMFGFLLFTALYFAVLYLQADSTSGYDVALGHQPLLPPNFSADQSYTFGSPDDLYTWINESIIQVFWKDPECGNGVCEAPLEYSSFGSQGCNADCGSLGNLTTIVVTMESNFDSDDALAASSWNLCMTNPNNLCWFSTDEVFTSKVSALTEEFEVPDGDWEVVINAPFGGVRGMVQAPLPGMSYAAVTGVKQMEQLVSWGECYTEDKSPLWRCRGVCSNLIGCLRGMPCGNELTDTRVSGAFVDCVNQCNYADLAMLAYENMTCAEAAKELSGTLLSNFNCTGNHGARGLSSTKTTQEVTWEGQSGMLNRRRYRQKRSVPFVQSVKVEKTELVGQQDSGSSYEELVKLLSSIRWGQGSSALWEALGGTDEQRVFNLKVAVNRVLHTMVKDKCLAEHALPVGSASLARMTAFLCTLFGGPIYTLEACNYTDPISRKQLAGPEELITAMRTAHASLYVSQRHQAEFTGMLMAAVHSVVEVADSTAADMEHILRVLDSTVVSPNAPSCNLDGPVLDWQKGQQHDDTIFAGGKVTWVWADDEPHSIKLSGLGEPNERLFEGFGSNRLVVSRLTRCSPSLVGPNDADGSPTPCVLRPPGDESTVFTYTKVFTNPGTIFYSGGRFGSSVSGVLTVLPPPKVMQIPAVPLAQHPPPPALPHATKRGFGKGLFPRLEEECSPGCTYADLSDGQCHAACFTETCAFDGGDCACASQDLNFGQCKCNEGQARDSTGACCMTTTYGTARKFPFKLRTLGRNLTLSLGRFATNANVTLQRFVSDRNRLLVGMYIFQHRVGWRNCSGSLFGNLSNSCFGPTSNDPFGVNPHYLARSSLYDQNADETMAKYKNSSFGFDLQISSYGVPYGFVYPQKRLREYPLVFDINLDNSAATRRLQYLVDGFFVDNATRSIQIMFITFNVEAELLVVTKLSVAVTTGGAMVAHANVHPFNPQTYQRNSSEDMARFVLEIVLASCILFNLFGEILEMLAAKAETGRVTTYFQNFWNWVDLLSIGLQLTCIGLWVYMAVLVNSLVIQPRYDIYFTLQEFPEYWVTKNPPSGFEAALDIYYQIDYLIQIRAIYFTLQGVNVIFLTTRLLKLFDFQPYLGYITRAIRVAAPSLVHFFVLWFMVFLSFSFFAYLVFGSSIEQFSSVRQSMLTCFLIILGDNSVYYFLLHQDGYFYFAAVTFLVTYTLVMCFVLLNFLVAIVVDAFMEVKDGDANSTTILQDVVNMAKHTKTTIATGYGGRYTPLMQDLSTLAAWKAQPLEEDTKAQKNSLRRILKKLNLFHYFAGAAKPAVATTNVIRFGDRELDTMAVGTILQRCRDRHDDVTTGLLGTDSDTSWSKRMMSAAVPKAIQHSFPSTKAVDTQRLAGAVMRLLGEDVQAHEVRGPARKKHSLAHISAKLDTLQVETQTTLSELKTLMAVLQAEVMALRATQAQPSPTGQLRQQHTPNQTED